MQLFFLTNTLLGVTWKLEATWNSYVQRKCAADVSTPQCGYSHITYFGAGNCTKYNCDVVWSPPQSKFNLKTWSHLERLGSRLTAQKPQLIITVKQILKTVQSILYIILIVRPPGTSKARKERTLSDTYLLPTENSCITIIVFSHWTLNLDCFGLYLCPFGVWW